MTGINYLDETWSPVTGCSGKNCKARCWVPDMVKRFPAIHGITQGLGGSWAKGDLQPERILFDRVQFHPDRLNQPLHWRKPRRIGVSFTGDWMDEQVPEKWISDIYVVMMECERLGLGHQFFTLTKQSKRLAEVIRPRVPLKNLYNGVSICDQEDADRMLPELLQIPGKHWVSVEPMLGPISLAGFDGKTYRPWLDRCAWPTLIDFIVIGTESGPKRRPCAIENMVDVVEQCLAAVVPVWVKQIDLNGRVCHDINLFPEALKVRELPCVT